MCNSKEAKLVTIQPMYLRPYCFGLCWYNFNFCTGTVVSGVRLDFRSLVAQLKYQNDHLGSFYDSCASGASEKTKLNLIVW